jgi:hypothetical protein
MIEYIIRTDLIVVLHAPDKITIKFENGETQFMKIQHRV